MSFSPSPSPPPPMPSPLLVPTPLPSPPPFTKITPRRHLTHAVSHDALHCAASTPRTRFAHDAPKAENRRRPASPPRVKRTPSRCRSPPPSPAIHSPPPPVPPIPAFVLTTHHSFIRPPRRPSAQNRVSTFDLYLDHPREHPPNMCCESQAGGALTCTIRRDSATPDHPPPPNTHSFAMRNYIASPPSAVFYYCTPA